MEFHMRRHIRYFAPLLFGAATIAAGDTGLKATVGGVEVATPAAAAQPAETNDPESSRKRCINRCESDNGRCNSEVRRGRQECSREAATGGGNPFTDRPDSYDYYCGYFNSDHCGYAGNRGACSQRFAQRYSECVEWMRGNVASRRYDCHRAETRAQALCRAELQDCRTQCG